MLYVGIMFSPVFKTIILWMLAALVNVEICTVLLRLSYNVDHCDSISGFDESILNVFASSLITHDDAIMIRKHFCGQ